MGLKIKTVSDLAMPLEVAPGFSVVVRRLGPQQAEDLNRQCSREKFNRLTGQMDMQIADALWNEHAPVAYIDVEATKHLDGNMLTSAVIRQLGIELAEEPAQNGHGVEVTEEIVRDLWRHAHAEKFAVPVMRFSREMLSALETAKKNAS